MSPGQTGWAVLEFQPVTYVAVCFVPDQATGKPQFAEGMFMPVTVPQSSRGVTHLGRHP